MGEHEEASMDGRGFSAIDWPYLSVFQGRCATPHDVDAGAAIFALGDTFNGRTLSMSLPQPVIWYDEDEEFAAVVVQAEVHETEDGEVLEVLGLVLPKGRTVVGFMDDVDEVDATDPVWVSLLEAERQSAADNDDEAGEEDWDEESLL
jgi:hypothetical protein